MELRKVLVNSRYWQRVVKPCKRCGEEFDCQPSKTERIHHCRPCNAIIRKPPGIITCEYCGTETQVKGHLVGVQKFCSPACKWNASTHDPSQSWRYARPRPCLECGTPFPPTRWRSLYCGRVCWGKSQSRRLTESYRTRSVLAAPPAPPKTPAPRRRPDRVCAQCGIVFNKERKRETTLLFCSRPCRSQYISGERHPLWKPVKHRDKRGPGWDALAESIRQRDNYRCQRCGTVQKDGRCLDVHHIEPYCVAQNNHPDNLVTLCNVCHKIVEHSPWRLLLENPTPQAQRLPK